VVNTPPGKIGVCAQLDGHRKGRERLDKGMVNVGLGGTSVGADTMELSWQTQVSNTGGL